MLSFIALVKKDLKGYFDQPTGYILLVVFVSLLAWSFFRSAFLTDEASLRPLFTINFAVENPSIPWLLALFTPAATMRLLAEEQRDGTLEILLTQPIQGWIILVSKFTSGLIFVSLAILTTIGIPIALATAGNLDWGAILSQYIGSIFLAAALVSIGLFTSSLTRNQIVSFIVGLFLTLILLLLGLDEVGISMPAQLATLLQTLSPITHFSSIARGVIDLRDVLYFVAIVSTFLSATFLTIRSRTLSHKSSQYRNLQLGTIALIILSVLIGWFGNSVQGRLDLTADKIFTLSDGTDEILSGLNDFLTIELYESKEPPVQVGIVARDVNDFLEDLANKSSGKIKLVKRHPDVDEEAARKAQLAGVPPVQFNVQTSDGLEIKNGFLGLTMTYVDRREVIPFIRSIDGFEYRVATLAYNMLQEQSSRKTIGFLTGYGGKRLAESFTNLGNLLSQQYDLLELEVEDDGSILGLPDTDVMIIPGPTMRMPEELYDSLHQYVQSGGKIFALMDGVVIDMQQGVAVPNQFNFGDFVEQYGVVLEDNLVFDLTSHETLRFGNVMRPYPYWVRALTVDRKVAGEVESVLVPWPSSLGLTRESKFGSIEYIPIFRTSEYGAADYTYSDIAPDSIQFENEELQLFANDLAVALDIAISNKSEEKARMVIVGDSEWLTDPIVTRTQENLALGLNLIDWLAQEEALADIRSKVITTRKLIFSSATHRNLVQYLNVGGIPIILIALGLVRYAKRRSVNQRTYVNEE